MISFSRHYLVPEGGGLCAQADEIRRVVLPRLSAGLLHNQGLLLKRGERDVGIRTRKALSFFTGKRCETCLFFYYILEKGKGGGGMDDWKKKGGSHLASGGGGGGAWRGIFSGRFFQHGQGDNKGGGADDRPADDASLGRKGGEMKTDSLN